MQNIKFLAYEGSLKATGRAIAHTYTDIDWKHNNVRNVIWLSTTREMLS